MINDFSSYFEIFSGLNLAYAGSKAFRNAIDDEILHIKNKIGTDITEKTNLLLSSIIVSIYEDYSTKISQKVYELNTKFENKSNKLLELEKVDLNFIEGFKTMFLASALYSIVLLLLGGYQGYFEDSKAVNIYLLCLCPVFIYNSVVFIISFTKYKNNTTKPMIVISLFFSLFFIAIIAHLKCPYYYILESFIEEKYCISFSLLIAVSPYLFHFLRIFLHKVYFKLMFYHLNLVIEDELKKIEDLVFFLKELDSPNKNYDIFD